MFERVLSFRRQNAQAKGPLTRGTTEAPDVSRNRGAKNAPQRAASGWSCVFLAVIGCLLATSVQATDLMISSDSGRPLRLIVENDGVGAAHFQVVTDDGGPVLAWLAATGAVIAPAQMTFSGTLSQDARVGVFGGFLDYIMESIIDTHVKIVSLDGRVIYDTFSDLTGTIERTKDRPRPLEQSTVLFRGTPITPGVITDFPDQLGVYPPHAGLYPSGVILFGFGPPGDIGAILGNRSMSGFDLPISIFRISIGIPEPATWALLIAGFGLVGLALRGRPRSAGRSAPSN